MGPIDLDNVAACPRVRPVLGLISLTPKDADNGPASGWDCHRERDNNLFAIIDDKRARVLINEHHFSTVPFPIVL